MADEFESRSGIQQIEIRSAVPGSVDAIRSETLNLPKTSEQIRRRSLDRVYAPHVHGRRSGKLLTFF